MNKETLRMQMLAGIITEGQYKQKLNESYSKLKFNQVERGRKYFATTNFGIFKKGEEVIVDTVRNLGTEVVLELSNSKGKHDSIKGDLDSEVKVFGNNSSLNENKNKYQFDIMNILNRNGIDEDYFDSMGGKEVESGTEEWLDVLSDITGKDAYTAEFTPEDNKLVQKFISDMEALGIELI
jgi:hypothetical protein